MGPIGIQELVLILVIALLVFGPKKLPELGRSIGKTLAEFRRASNELKHNIEKERDEPESK
jgi:TatA/E family protein of Tat protein translocase